MNLSADFFFQQPVDFEHKNYLLLAFLKSVQNDFSSKKIYPALGSVIRQIKTLKAFREQQKNINDRLKRIRSFDWKNLEFEYQQQFETEEITEINKIVDHSLEQLDPYFHKGSELFEGVAASLNWKIIGILPNYIDEGYLIVHVRPKSFLSYQYRIGQIQLNHENYFGISLELKDETQSRFITYTDLKKHLIGLNPDLPVPLTIAVETDPYPLSETLLPVIKTQAVIKIKKVGRA